MKKTMVIVVILLLSFTFSHQVLATTQGKDDGVVYGVKFSLETISKTNDINGGGYFFINPVISFNDKFSLNLRYSTDLSPNTFSDHIISITPQFYKAYSKNNLIMYIGLTYLRSSDDNYFGIKFCPLTTGREDGVMIDVLPISYLYSPETLAKIIMFEVFTIGFYF